MPVYNKDIVDQLNELADLLEIKGENEFRVRAYRNAVRILSGYSGRLAKEIREGEDLSEISGIGDSIQEKVEEIVNTGKLKQLENLKKEIPESLLEIMSLEQMGPRRTKTLYEELDIDSIDDLKKAAKSGDIESLEGFGKKTVENILKEIEEYADKGGSDRIKWSEGDKIATSLKEYMKDKVDDIEVAGSYRRKKATLGDIDILVTSKDKEKCMRAFTTFEDVDRVLSQGDTKSSVKLRNGVQVDLRLVDKNSFGAALLYFTGAKEHSIALRKIAQKKDYTLNEYGVHKDDEKLASKTEKSMYKALGLKYIEPELRENRGEIEAARDDKLPNLIKPEDIRGDLHTHTKRTDGLYSLKEMAQAAKDMGYDYYAVSDHSKKVSMADGLDEKRLGEQIEEINELNESFSDFRICKAIEVDILKDGTLDLSDDILKELDFVIGAIHYNRNLSRKEQTQRVLKAMENPHFNILAHPTGRMLGERSAYDIDIKAVLDEAKDKGCYLEINANPQRLDLNDENARIAKEKGVKLAISTDAHSKDSLNYMRYGVAQARRGWLEKNDVLNTRSWKSLKKLLKR
ncbi:MAG: DNA polymerase/3'-5' exonuclease PolX [Bacteroidales bacterium]